MDASDLGQGISHHGYRAIRQSDQLGERTQQGIVESNFDVTSTPNTTSSEEPRLDESDDLAVDHRGLGAGSSLEIGERDLVVRAQEQLGEELAYGVRTYDRSKQGGSCLHKT
ncbi:hypothetical protein [Sanguibacter antarcticus]|uniref:hypothetical protein n=1 Tax=Sanguibacter antarcticus TaxID=372484 RepID=UPI00117BA236|nr:hypothetical protein [Sanguibacter antarcticus]